MWKLVLTDLTCVTETSGSGDDEVVALFRVDGTHPETGRPITHVTGLSAEDCASGTSLVSGSTLTGVAPVGSLALSDEPPGIELTAAVALSTRRLEHPGLPLTVTTIGLEIDGSDSASEHGGGYITEFARTGTVDPTVGVDDDVLWGLTWTIDRLDDGTIAATSPTQLFDDSALGGTFAPVSRDVSSQDGALTQTVTATNADQSSCYTFIIEGIGRR